MTCDQVVCYMRVHYNQLLLCIIFIHPLELDKFLVYARSKAVRLRPLYSGTGEAASVPEPRYTFPAATPVSHDQLNYIAVAVDTQDNWIYYSDVRKDIIHRVHPDGTGTSTWRNREHNGIKRVRKLFKSKVLELENSAKRAWGL